MEARKMVERLALVAAIIGSDPSLSPAVAAKSRELNEMRSNHFTWIRENLEKDADGKSTFKMKVSTEEFQKREKELETKTLEFLSEAQPLISLHEARMAEEALKALGDDKGFTFGNPGGSGNATGKTYKSLYDHCKESDAFKGMLDGVPSQPQVGWNQRTKFKDVSTKSLLTPGQAEFKATLDTATGYPMPLNRTGMVVPFAHRIPVVQDYINTLDWQVQMNFVYMEASVWTNAAAMVAEGAVKPESALAWVERSVKLEVLAHQIPVTKQALMFGPDLENVMKREMITQLRLKEEDQLLAGTGTSPQMNGILTRPGIQTYARLNTETNLDAILTALQMVFSVGHTQADRILMAVDVCTAIRKLKDSTGRYIFGDPGAFQIGADGPVSTIWGIPFQQTTALSTGKCLVGGFSMWLDLLRGSDVIVEVGYVNNQLITNSLTILVEEYVNLLVKRPAAFVTLTNMSVG